MQCWPSYVGKTELGFRPINKKFSMPKSKYNQINPLDSIINKFFWPVIWFYILLG